MKDERQCMVKVVTPTCTFVWGEGFEQLIMQLTLHYFIRVTYLQYKFLPHSVW